MLFVPREQAKKALKKLREDGKKRRRKRTLERRQEYLKAKEEGRLDEYYAEIDRKWNALHPPEKSLDDEI